MKKISCARQLFGEMPQGKIQLRQHQNLHSFHVIIRTTSKDIFSYISKNSPNRGRKSYAYQLTLQASSGTQISQKLG